MRKLNVFISKCLGNYILITSKDLFGSLTLVYAKISLKERFSKISDDSIKLSYNKVEK